MSYLTRLKNRLRIDSVIKDDFIREIEGHLEDRIHELRDTGMTESEATETATHLLGSPQIIAKEIYGIYSQGSWKQTIFAVLPHFLTAALIALHWWTNPFWLTLILLGVVGAVIYGWFHGKPTWLFSWMGFLLIPVIIAGVILIYLPGDWALVSTLVYVPLAVFILIVIAKQILVIDWLYLSLMLLPIPIVIAWLIVLSRGNTLIVSDQITETALWISFSFAVIGLGVAIFIRVKQRWMKAAALLVCSVLILTILTLVGANSFNFLTGLFLCVLILLDLALPAFLEHKVIK